MSAVEPREALRDRVAVVTGASRGIGAATASALARAGARVALLGRDPGALDRKAAAITADGGDCRTVRVDCTDADELDRARQEVRDHLGVPSLLVAFAGGRGEPVPTATETPAHWREVLETNLTATFLTVRAFVPDLARTHGSIITMASESGRQVTRTSAAYTASKAGIVALTGYLAEELGPDRIRVNCIAPSTIDTEQLRAHTSPEVREAIARSFPLGRLGTTDDVTGAVLFLASAAAGWITGTTLDLAGGRTTLW
jgi:3-oxoacyl-[acyl-carrier protein] reductase